MRNKDDTNALNAVRSRCHLVSRKTGRSADANTSPQDNGCEPSRDTGITPFLRALDGPFAAPFPAKLSAKASLSYGGVLRFDLHLNAFEWIIYDKSYAVNTFLQTDPPHRKQRAKALAAPRSQCMRRFLKALLECRTTAPSAAAALAGKTGTRRGAEAVLRRRAQCRERP